MVHKIKDCMKRFIIWISNCILIKRGKMRCSGYGVYPRGMKCIGCSDCKGKNKIKF